MSWIKNTDDKNIDDEINFIRDINEFCYSESYKMIDYSMAYKLKTIR